MQMDADRALAWIREGPCQVSVVAVSHNAGGETGDPSHDLDIPPALALVHSTGSQPAPHSCIGISSSRSGLLDAKPLDHDHLQDKLLLLVHPTGKNPAST